MSLRNAPTIYVSVNIIYNSPFRKIVLTLFMSNFNCSNKFHVNFFTPQVYHPRNTLCGRAEKAKKFIHREASDENTLIPGTRTPPIFDGTNPVF
jgi:hypothetical protein